MTMPDPPSLLPPPARTADDYLRECVQIEPMALEEEFVRIPADLAYWNNRYSDAYRLWLECKIESERVEADISTGIRRELANNPKSRATVAEVEHLLKVDPAYVDARRREAAAESEKVRLYGVLDALRSKRDMLISLGAHMRAEMANDPLIRRQRALERDVKEARDQSRVR